MLQPTLNQIDFVLRGLDALRRFLLEGMNNPNLIANLHSIDDTKGIAAERQCDFKDAGAETFERLGNVGLAALCRDGQSVEADGLSLDGELLKVLARCLDPRDGPRLSDYGLAAKATGTV